MRRRDPNKESNGRMTEKEYKEMRKRNKKLEDSQSNDKENKR